jgi:hypothetical protein
MNIIEQNTDAVGLSEKFAETIHIPNTMTVGKYGADVTQAEMALAYQVLALGKQSAVNEYTEKMINDMHSRGEKFVHDHSAFRTFFSGEKPDVDKIDSKNSRGGRE